MILFKRSFKLFILWCFIRIYYSFGLDPYQPVWNWIRRLTWFRKELHVFFLSFFWPKYLGLVVTLMYFLIYFFMFMGQNFILDTFYYARIFLSIQIFWSCLFSGRYKGFPHFKSTGKIFFFNFLHYHLVFNEVIVKRESSLKIHLSSYVWCPQQA